MPVKLARLAAILAALTCAGAVSAERARLRVVGTVQDGGLPHAGCSCSRCEAAASEPGAKRHVASVALIVPSETRAPSIYLIDASPDIVHQLRMLTDVRTGTDGGVDRSPLDGVFLTHAHIGHYLGLAHFGYEALNIRGLNTHCSPRMATFLRESGPWSQLVELGNIEIQEQPPGSTVELPGGVRVTSISVPHREEYSDTVAYRFDGPDRRVLYMPDCDPWHRWEASILEILTAPEHPIDVFIVDGTFYSGEELPGRDLLKIGHPLITDSIDLFQPLVDSGTIDIRFTHLNHTNPAIDPRSEAAREIEKRGFRVLREGEEVGL